MLESTENLGEVSPFFCFICENAVEASRFHENDATVRGTVSVSTPNDDKTGETLDCCESCFVIVKTVCKLYDDLSNVQLRLNWNLQKIGEIMKNCNKTGNNQHKGDAMEKRDFKSQFIEKVDAKHRSQYPHLKLDKITPPKNHRQDLENQNIFVVKVETCNDDDEEDFLPDHQSMKLETYDDDDDDEDDDSVWDPDDHDADSCELDMEMDVEIEDHDDVECPVEPEEHPNLKSEQTAEKYKIPGHKEMKQTQGKKIAGTDTNKKFPCAFCDKQFDRKTSIWKHQQKFHKEEKLYPCPTCGERFSNLQKRQTHELSHRDKPYNLKCRFCTKTFLSTHERIRHEWRHTGLKPFLCTVCEQRFNDGGNARRHVRRRHGSVDDAKIVKCFNSYKDFKVGAKKKARK